MIPESTPTLQGRLVTLRPLQREHASRLYELAEGQNIWEWYPEAIRTQADMNRVIDDACAQREQGLALPFITVENSTGLIVGSTRFFAIVKDHRRVEIGWTWIGPRWQRSGINVEAKYLMFSYAFEEMGCVRVELKTDNRNTKSQNAMAGLGLVREGVLRSHMITHSGHLRDTVYFSAIQKEWPELKIALEKKMTLNTKTHTKSEPLATAQIPQKR